MNASFLGPAGSARRALLVGAVVIAGAIALPFLIGTHPLQLITEGLVVGVAAMSFIFLHGYAGLTSMVQMAYFAVAGYAIAIITVDRGGNFWLAALIGIVAAGLTALLFALVAYKSQGIFFLMMSLALSQLVYGVAMQWSSVTRGYDGFAGIPRPAIGDWSLSSLVPRYYFFVVVTLLVYLILQVFTRSRFGLSIRALRLNSEKAAALGMNVRAKRLTAHVIAGALAGLAGVLGAIHYGVVSPATTGLNEILRVIMAAIIGGALWLEGGVIGSIVVVYLISIISGYTERYWIVVGTLFVLVVIFFPNGIVGSAKSIAARVRGGQGKAAGPEAVQALKEPVTEAID